MVEKRVPTTQKAYNILEAASGADPKEVRLPDPEAADSATPSTHEESSEGENKIENADYTDTTSLSSDDFHRVAQKITLTGGALQSASFWVKRVANPSGTVYARVRKVSDDSIIETSSRQIDVMTISSEESWETFPFTCAPNEEVRICLEFNGGDGNNRVSVYFDSGNPIVGNGQRCYEEEWSDAWSPDYDATIKILLSAYGAENTVDDNLSTYWVPDPANESGAWISWDVGSCKYIGGCRIYWGSEVAYRPTEYKIYTSPDGSTWTEVIHETEAAPASAWKEYQWYIKYAQYIKLIVTTHGSSGMKMHEVDGYSKSTENALATHGHGGLS